MHEPRELICRGLVGKRRNDEHLDPRAHGKTALGWTGLSDTETVAPLKLSMFILYSGPERQGYCTQVTKEAGVIGCRWIKVWLISVGAGTQEAVLRLQPWEWVVEVDDGGHFLNTMSTLALGPEEG